MSNVTNEHKIEQTTGINKNFLKADIYMPSISHNSIKIEPEESMINAKEARNPVRISN